MDEKKYIAKQEALLEKLSIPETGEFQYDEADFIFTFDIQYKGDIGFVAVDLMEFSGKTLGTFVGKYPVTEEYKPGFFAFREGPLLLAALEDVIAKSGITPLLLVIDGHGTAHPRKMGVATWMGIKSGITSIGVAKDTLVKVPYKEKLSKEEDATLEVRLDDELVGFVLRTSENVKPVFVSAGNGISQEGALQIAKLLKGEFRILEPIRRADQIAREASRGERPIDLP